MFGDQNRIFGDYLERRAASPAGSGQDSGVEELIFKRAEKYIIGG